LAYDSKDDQSTTKGDSGYRYIEKNITRPTAEDLQGGKAREIETKIMALDMDSEATVDTRDFVHGSAKLPKDVRNKNE
jgi:hypothetical protein